MYIGCDVFLKFFLSICVWNFVGNLVSLFVYKMFLWMVYLRGICFLFDLMFKDILIMVLSMNLLKILIFSKVKESLVFLCVRVWIIFYNLVLRIWMLYDLYVWVLFVMIIICVFFLYKDCISFKKILVILFIDFMSCFFVVFLFIFFSLGVNIKVVFWIFFCCFSLLK